MKAVQGWRQRNEQQETEATGDYAETEAYQNEENAVYPGFHNGAVKEAMKWRRLRATRPAEAKASIERPDSSEAKQKPQHHAVSTFSRPHEGRPRSFGDVRTHALAPFGEAKVERQLLGFHGK